MTDSTIEKQNQITEAALKVFSQYGYKRTTMNDIAEFSGMSRAALYLHFKNKEEIFQSLALKLHQRSLDAVANAFEDKSLSFKERLSKAVLSKFGVYEFVHQSPQGIELMTAGMEVASSLATDFEADYINLLVANLEKAEGTGEISFDNLAMNAQEFAELLAGSIIGIEKRNMGSEEVKNKITSLVRVFGSTL